MSSSPQLTFSEPPALGAATASEFEVEPVQGRKVSKVVKTTVVRGERMEKQTGDASLATDLPSAREDFEKVSVQTRTVTHRVNLSKCFHYMLRHISHNTSVTVLLSRSLRQVSSVCPSSFLLLIPLSPLVLSPPGIELCWRLWESAPASCSRERGCAGRRFCG